METLRTNGHTGRIAATRPAPGRPARPTRGGHPLADRFGIDEQTLDLRRQFIRLGDAELQILAELTPWAEEHGPEVVREFYDWQFEFGPTVRFFESFAETGGHTLGSLRQHLETAQTGYFTGCFAGAASGYDVAYFETRLHIGKVHDRINLPFKWYAGAYSELGRLTREHLGREHPDAEYVDRAMEALQKVWNLDLQAIADSFLLSTVESFGMDVTVIEADPGTDRTEHFSQIKDELNALLEQNADFQGQIEAIGRAQAVIEFDVDGTIRTANDNFLQTLGYTLDEIEGRHHRMFVDAEHAQSAEYRQFWEALARGEYQASEFRRIGKDSEEVWIQASYNPIYNRSGELIKIVKFASDISDRVKARLRLEQSVEQMLQTVQAAAQGDLTQEIDVEGDDTIGQMAEGLRQFLAGLRTDVGQIAENAQHLAAASEEMSSISTQMGTDAETTSGQAGAAASAAEQVDKNVQTVATGAEEMSASIKEVAGNAADAARIAAEAVAAAERTNATVSKLGESSVEIGNVIKVITSIAQQTNLLALNATIEAARAGEAGKGFAVVANEVKELAKQTAQATEDIGQKIETIQGDTQNAVQAIGQIGGIIGQINDIQGTIASAVEEQSATTAEIARNVNEAARGSTEIAENITGVAQAAESTSGGARDGQQASTELARMAATLQQVVAKFQYA
ncbi:methyl-accepting chemotaxis protein [Rubrivirga litoralis]|uniref:Methyl-accepting chemotaxis protein n=1 Tax=Rubrivirga litoralis TaxID=3075598 RepID=A0ABU3BPM9_9BACT|nr:methyl-accepting chemotaxis protein [Rubrivirga sp. F394]MDT0631249.1 methyl-accepting chemotaxis protein [Rubrivirga sp. F394]